MTKQEKVAAWMASLGFVKGQHYFTRKDSEMDISDDEATFFYDVTNAARLDELNAVALDNYRGQTFSDSTNWKGKLQKFIDNNERRLRHLKQEGKTQ